MRLALRLAVVLLALAVVGVFYVRYTVKRMFPQADPARIEALKSSGRPIVEALEAYRRIHGRYPDDLKAIGEAGSSAAKAGWEYRMDQGGKGFFLHVGVYRTDHFVLMWSSDDPDWMTDQ